MKIIEGMQQGSSEWHAFRKKKVMASDISSICGVNPFRSIYQVWLDKIGMGKPTEINENMKRGIELEPIAREQLSAQLGFKFHPAVVEYEPYEFLGASLDGLSGNYICEIKCPAEKGFITAKQGMIPDRYMLQMQQQLLCTGADLCFFCAYYEGELAIVQVKPDTTAQSMIIEESKKFWHENVLGFKAPEMGKGDYVERDDEQYFALVSKWNIIQDRKKYIVDQEEEIREQLLTLTNRQNTRGLGLSLSHFPRRGNIEYSKIPVLQGIDLDPYRKPPTQVCMIRSMGDKN